MWYFHAISFRLFQAMFERRLLLTLKYETKLKKTQPNVPAYFASVSDEVEERYAISTWVCVVKLFTAVVYFLQWKVRVCIAVTY
jgi:hypothetical protein